MSFCRLMSKQVGMTVYTYLASQHALSWGGEGEGYFLGRSIIRQVKQQFLSSFYTIKYIATEYGRIYMEYYRHGLMDCD